MTDFTPIAGSEIDAGSPLTDTVMTRMRDNPQAAAEGASGAYKFALKSAIGTFSGSNLDFGGLDDFSGVWFQCYAVNTSGGFANLSFDATDGSYLGAQILLTLPLSTAYGLTGFFDFATGLVRGCYGGNASTSTPGTFSQTILGASTGITGIRFTGASGVAGSVLIHPNGGESSS